MSSAFLFNVLYSGFRKVTQYLGTALKSNEQFNKSFANLKGSLLTALQPIYETLLPVILTLMNVASRFVQAIGNIFATLSGKSSAQMAKNAEALYDQTKATEDLGNASKKASKSLAGFDEIQKLSEPSAETAAENTQASAANFEEFKTEDYQTKIDALTTYVSMGLLALGAILAFSGVNIPLGIALLALGATGLVSQIATNWGGLKKALSGSIGMIVAVLSTALLAIGAILAFSGTHIPLGIGLMIAGAAGLGTTVAANWGTIAKALKGPIGGVVALLSTALLAIGAVLCFTGAALGLGIGLMVAGAAGLATVTALNWNAVIDSMRGTVGEIVAIVSGALLALGAVLCFTGVATGLGIGLMVAGAAGLAAVVTINWSSIIDSMRGTVGEIIAIVSGALLALGAVLCFTGAATGLGIGLMIAGAVGLATVVATNWNSLKQPISAAISSIMVILGSAMVVIGFIMCLTGAGLGVGLALILTGLTGTIASVSVSDNPITRFVKSVANSVLSFINLIIEGINWLFHIRFDGLTVAGVQIIPKMDFKLLDIPPIPYLAEGAVLPANKPFLSVVGDQRHGTNIEAPLSTIQEAVALVMEDYAAANMAGHEATVAVLRDILEAVLGIHVGDDVIGQAVSRYNAKMSIIRGGSV